MSNLRCWPGCLAYITHPSMFGRMVEVIELAPHGMHRLPDGYRSLNDLTTPAWVVRFTSPIQAPLGETRERVRSTHYAVVQDHYLRPITPPPGAETETVADVIEAARSTPVEA